MDYSEKKLSLLFLTLIRLRMLSISCAFIQMVNRDTSLYLYICTFKMTNSSPQHITMPFQKVYTNFFEIQFTYHIIHPCAVLVMYHLSQFPISMIPSHSFLRLHLMLLRRCTTGFVVSPLLLDI